jgi:hypothetical protein
MNPTPEEDTMRQRSHPSAIVLATLLACLLFATDRASAEEGITVIVPVNVTNLHEHVVEVQVFVYLKQLQPNNYYQRTGSGYTTVPVVNHSVQQDVEVLVTPFSISQSNITNVNMFAAEQYYIFLTLHAVDPTSAPQPGGATPCFINDSEINYNAEPHLSNSTSDRCRQGWNLMQTYSALEGPISDLIPE